MLPQSFKNSLTIFGNQLSKELEGWQQEHLEAAICRWSYSCSDTEGNNIIDNKSTFFNSVEYTAIKKKAHVACWAVIYLGFTIILSLQVEQKEMIYQIQVLKLEQELWDFSGMDVDYGVDYGYQMMDWPWNHYMKLLKEKEIFWNGTQNTALSSFNWKLLWCLLLDFLIWKRLLNDTFIKVVILNNTSDHGRDKWDISLENWTEGGHHVYEQWL